MSIRNTFKKIIEFIGKDTKIKNESKKTILVIRNIIISILVYFFISAVIGSRAKSAYSTWIHILFILIFSGIFAASYRFKTRTVLRLFSVGAFGFILAIMSIFGWNVGVQHFLMVMLLLYFFSGYEKYRGKFIYAAVLCILRLILFFVFHTREPLLKLEPTVIDFLQILNTVVIFWCLSFTAYIFSKDSQELEGKLVMYNSQLQKQANTDNLTGLYNRRKAWEYLNRIVNEKDLRKSCSVCICDIDFFKKVNDNYGHDMGDEVLKGIAKIFLENVTGENLAARWGGEEFLLVFLGENADDVYVKLEQLRRKIKNMRIWDGAKEIAVTMTFGLMEHDFSKTMEETIQSADQKLYQGKEAGRDRIVY